MLGRSHRAAAPKARITEVIDRSHRMLGLPADWKLAVVPGSDTGAVEMALWSLLGPNPVDVLSFETFSTTWAADIVKHLKLPNTRVLDAEFGALPDLHGIAVFLASDASAYITGQCFAVDGGILAAL